MPDRTPPGAGFSLGSPGNMLFNLSKLAGFQLLMEVFMRSLFVGALLGASLLSAGPANAQQIPVTNIADMAATPLVRVNISETLRSRPDEASLTVDERISIAAKEGYDLEPFRPLLSREPSGA